MPRCNEGSELTKIQTRQTELAMLKILAFLCVVCLHVAAKPWQVLSVDTWQWKIASCFRGSWGVPVFVMISGRFLLDPERDVSIQKLKKYFLRAVTAFLFWSLAYEVYQLAVAYPSRNVEYINWKWEVVEFMTGEYHLWYLPMLAGLYLVTPFLRKITQDRALTQWYLFLFVAFESIACYGVNLPKIGALIKPIFDNMHFRFAMGYTGYYVMGYYLFSVELSRNKEYALYIAGAVTMVLSSTADVLYGVYLGDRSSFFTGNLSPNIMLSATAIFAFFCKAVPRINIGEALRRWIEKLEKLGFGAYLIHVLFICLLTDFIGIESLKINPLLWIPVLTVLIAAISLICAALIRKIPKVGRFIA